ncbi:hypothetical protein U9M48_014707 [Paspalum notatum var. saurae]|uniref:Uncharacterized protein n=1 Tax=Paspalum notatum var. saurae TaxID=547442 RepID=A0AAQ3T2L8_PASNO
MLPLPDPVQGPEADGTPPLSLLLRADHARAGELWARVVLPHPNSANPHTIVVYGANEEEAYLKAVTTAITFLSPEEDAGHSDLRYLPTQEMDDEWVRRHDMLKARNDTRPYAACMGFSSEMHRMYDRAEGRSRFYFHVHAEARARVEELEGRGSATAAPRGVRAASSGAGPSGQGVL